MKLDELGLTSRIRRHANNRAIGGQTFRTGALSHLLANRIYIGEARHHKQHFQGEHEPIMDKALFEAVRAELAARLNRKNLATSVSKALLKGLLFDSKGNRMTPVHARKAGVRYCYYQSWVLAQGQKDKAGVVARVPAGDIEQSVLAAWRERFPSQDARTKCDDGKAEPIERVVCIDILQDVLNIRTRSRLLIRNSARTNLAGQLDRFKC